MTEEKKTHHMKRWEIYSIIGIVAVVVGLAMAGAFYYVTNVAGDQAAVTTTDTVARTTEEKDLSDIKTDLEADSALDMSDVDSDLQDLESIDLSGV